MLDLILVTAFGYLVGLAAKNTIFGPKNGAGWAMALLVAAMGWIVAVIGFSILADLYLRVGKTWAGSSSAMFAMGLFWGVKRSGNGKQESKASDNSRSPEKAIVPCPTCRANLRVDAGKHIEIHCPKCGNSFESQT